MLLICSHDDCDVTALWALGIDTSSRGFRACRCAQTPESDESPAGLGTADI